ncbi:flagellar hook-basal body complex protein, partial [Desulfonatronospira sp. MSAO_Bac3]|uniref:flagellar hook-basal body complex protein n=1 Tax=Desulfonatronospira sp. MSAO_Bac3 TaxID=2293857 RepID=UPI000FF404DD
MGLSSSMYTGVSGLKGHGEKMGTIGNNISNVSTVGFKGSRMHFEDFMSQDINTGAGVGQVGRGVGIGAVMNDFSQGSLESTNEATDVAIGGNGFFQVSARGTDENMYTRAGNFRFDEDGYLVDPNNNIVQGWEVREDPPGVADEEEIIQTETGVEIQGAPGDIRLDDFQSSPEATTRVDKIMNLDSRSD